MIQNCRDFHHGSFFLSPPLDNGIGRVYTVLEITFE